MWGGCGRDATAQVCIKVWSTATPPLLRTAKNCVRMLSGVTICKECKASVKAEYNLLPESTGRIANGLSRAGFVSPDFTSAQLDFDEIIDTPVDPVEFARRGGAKILEV